MKMRLLLELRFLLARPSCGLFTRPHIWAWLNVITVGPVIPLGRLHRIPRIWKCIWCTLTVPQACCDILMPVTNRVLTFQIRLTLPGLLNRLVQFMPYHFITCGNPSFSQRFIPGSNMRRFTKKNLSALRSLLVWIEVAPWLTVYPDIDGIQVDYFKESINSFIHLFKNNRYIDV